MNEETNKLLAEILLWQKIIGINYLKESAEKILDTEKKKQIFDLTGKVKRDEIKNKLKVSTVTISEIWTQCYAAGLLIPEGKGYRKLVELKELGMRL